MIYSAYGLLLSVYQTQVRLLRWAVDVSFPRHGCGHCRCRRVLAGWGDVASIYAFDQELHSTMCITRTRWCSEERDWFLLGKERARLGRCNHCHFPLFRGSFVGEDLVMTWQFDSHLRYSHSESPYVKSANWFDANTENSKWRTVHELEDKYKISKWPLWSNV